MTKQQINKQLQFAKVSTPSEAAEDAIEYEGGGGSFSEGSGSFYIQKPGQGSYLVEAKIGGRDPCEELGPPCTGAGTCGDTSINYTTLQMGVGESQSLSVAGAKVRCTYTWRILSGGGSLVTSTPPSQGTSAVYTAPADNEDCELNPTIGLYAMSNCPPPEHAIGDGTLCDSIKIAVSEVHADHVAYTKKSCTEGYCVEGSEEWMCPYITVDAYGCQDDYLRIVEKCFNILCTGPACTCAGWTDKCTATTCGGLDGLECGNSTYPDSPPAATGEAVDRRSEWLLTNSCCPAELL